MKKITDILKLISSVVAVVAIIGAIAKPHIENFIDERIEVKIISTETMEKAMNSPFMLDYKRDQKKEWADAELHKDQSKLKFSGTLVSKTGMNKEAMSDTLANMIKQHCLNKKYVTNSECILNSKNYGRGSVRLTGM
jgi:hypothetical protein